MLDRELEALALVAGAFYVHRLPHPESLSPSNVTPYISTGCGATADDLEFYLLLRYMAEVDLNVELGRWKRYCNCHCPRLVLEGESP